MKRIYLIVVSVLALLSPILHAQSAWGFESVSPPIHRLGQLIEQPFEAAKLASPPSNQANIAAINVQVSPTASAWVESRLCTQNLLHCLPIHGGRLYTKAFNEFAANTPLVVAHQLQSWNGAYPPVHIKVQLTLWWE